MRIPPWLLRLGLLLGSFLPGSLVAASAPPVVPVRTPEPDQPVWEVHLQNFDVPIYDREVEKLITQFEASTGRRLVPGAKGKVGLKIYTDSGEGLSTPKGLTIAVIDALVRRGFERENIFLVGLNQFRMMMTKYLPSLSTGETLFEDIPIYVLETGRYYDETWYYTSPLPTNLSPAMAEEQIRDISAYTTREQDRKSFLATPLFLDADFWINLPVYTDHPVLGVNGALVNATLWNASNTARFFRSPANAPVAVAEMSAIPELLDTWMFTIVSLERYQFIGGPFFNSLYSVSEPTIWLSTDPVLLDALMLKRMNDWRRRTGFQPINPDIQTLNYAAQLGVGSVDADDATIIELGE